MIKPLRGVPGIVWWSVAGGVFCLIVWLSSTVLKTINKGGSRMKNRLEFFSEMILLFIYPLFTGLTTGALLLET